MNVENALPQQPQNIMQAYRIANQIANASPNLDDKIKAYDKVINFCSCTDSCRLDDSVKKKMLLYWAYGKTASAYVQKKDTATALKYYDKSLKLARSTKEKIATLEKTANLYLSLGDMFNWFKAKESIIENLEDDDKREAYLYLARQAVEENETVDYLEKALQSISKEDSSVDEKSRNILTISQRLLQFYKFRKDKENWLRLKRLSTKIERLRQKLHKK